VMAATQGSTRPERPRNTDGLASVASFPINTHICALERYLQAKAC
jgi:hypothetical protein